MSENDENQQGEVNCDPQKGEVDITLEELRSRMLARKTVVATERILKDDDHMSPEWLKACAGLILTLT